MFEHRNGQLMLLSKVTTLVGVNTALSVLHKRVQPLSPAEFVLSKLDSVHFRKVSAPNGTVFHGPPCQTSAAVKAALAGFFRTVDNLTLKKLQWALKHSLQLYEPTSFEGTTSR